MKWDLQSSGNDAMTLMLEKNFDTSSDNYANAGEDAVMLIPEIMHWHLQ